MKKILITLTAVLFAFYGNAQLFTTTSGSISFHSTTPVEDINAESKTVNGVMNPASREFAFLANMTTFQFPNKLMQEHFNEKYIESDKFPMSSFKGKIQETVDLTKDGEHKVTVVGKLNIHGVEQERTITGTVSVKGGEIKIKSEFQVKVADHKIEIPKLVVKNIAEVVDVKFNVVLVPKK